MTFRTEQLAEGITLYCGDCLEVLPTLGRFDAVVTDIPYQLAQETNGLRSLSYGAWDEAGADEIAFKAMNLCVSVPSVLVFSEWRQTSRLSDTFSGRSSRLVAWSKTNPTVMNGQHLFLPGLETAYYGKLPGAWFGGSCVSSVWTGPAPVNRQHPTEKPLPLMRWCVVNTVPPDGVCLDPFMGSGTTGVACAKLGRKFTGIEMDPGYFDIACKRISAALKEPDLFIEPPKPAHQLSILDSEAAA